MLYNYLKADTSGKKYSNTYWTGSGLAIFSESICFWENITSKKDAVCILDTTVVHTAYLCFYLFRLLIGIAFSRCYDNKINLPPNSGDCSYPQSGITKFWRLQ